MITIRIYKLWLLMTSIVMMAMIVLASYDEHHHPIITTSAVSRSFLERRMNNNNIIIYSDHDDDEYEQQLKSQHSDQRNVHNELNDKSLSSWFFSIFHQITSRHIYPYFSTKSFDIDDNKSKDYDAQLYYDDSIHGSNQIMMSQSKRSRKTLVQEEEDVAVSQNSNNTASATIVCPMMSCGNGMELIPNHILSFDINNGVVSCEAVMKASNNGSYFTIEDCHFICNLMMEQNTCQCRRIIIKSSKFSKQSSIKTPDDYDDDDGLSIGIQNDDDSEPTARDIYGINNDDDDDDDSLIVGIQSDNDDKPTITRDTDDSNNDSDDDGLLVDIQSDDDGVLVAVTFPPSSKPSVNDEVTARIDDVPKSSPSLSSSITNQVVSDDDTSYIDDPSTNPTESFHPPYPLCVLCVSFAKNKETIENTREGIMSKSTTTSGSSGNGATFMTTKSITIKNTELVDMTEIPCNDAIDAGYLGLLTPSNCQYLKKVIFEQNACACQLSSSSETNQQQQQNASPSVSPIIDTTNNNVKPSSRLYYNIQRSKFTKIISSNEIQNPIANFTE